MPGTAGRIPLSSRHDPLGLVVRKVLRALAAWQPALWDIERLTHVPERVVPPPTLLRSLHRWTISGYIYRGYRQGLRELAEGRK